MPDLLVLAAVAVLAAWPLLLLAAVWAGARPYRGGQRV
jgi:hypothetical protein